MSNITNNALRDKIKAMLKDADLDKVTAKTVRMSLENEFKTSFDNRRKEISDIINNIINDSSSSSDDEIEDMHPVKKVKTGNKLPIKSESKKKSASSSSGSDDDDEAIARKLQEEEMGSGRRTRSGGSNSGKKNKPIKRKSKTNGNESSKKSKGGTGYMKPLPLSDELAEFTGESEMPRHAVVKRVWDYCKQNNLMDPRNKQFAICDEKLQRLVGVKRFRMFGMMKLLGKHFIPDS